jgi:hypothetical protein
MRQDRRMTDSRPDLPRRRRRGDRRAAQPGQAGTGQDRSTTKPQEQSLKPREQSPRRAGRPTPAGEPPKREPGERGLRDLVGAGPSQLGVSAALRGRDLNRPTDEDLAEAERDVVIVRRNWKPPE